MIGAILTKLMIRGSLLCYVFCLSESLLPADLRIPRAARVVWSLGCLLFVLHVGCAFQFYHHWSHASAFRTTADETQAMMGIAFGGGIYFSYLFLALWIADVVWLWSLAPTAAATPWWRVLLHAYLFFIAFNGAIVFEAGPTRWFGLAACGLLAVQAALAAARWLKQPERETVAATSPPLPRADLS